MSREGVPSVRVRRLGAGEGALLRDARMRSLVDAPQAFGQTLAEARRRPLEEWLTDARRAAQGDAHAWFLATADDDAVVGLIHGRRRRPDTLLVFSMWVDSGHRGLGVGRRLVEAVEAWGTSWGAVTTLLWVYARNEGAVRFYRRLGFEVERTGEDAVAGREYGALAMRRPIIASGA